MHNTPNLLITSDLSNEKVNKKNQENENNSLPITEITVKINKEFPLIMRPDSRIKQNIHFIQSKIEKETSKRERNKNINHLI